MKSLSVKSLLLGKRFVGVEHFSVKNVDTTAIAEVRKTKDGLIISKQEIISSFGVFPEKWDKNLPFYLVISTNQIIQKEVNSIDSSDEKLLFKAFPNLDREAFYYEIWRLKSKSIIAISRKSYVDELVSNYNKQSITIAGVSLGVASIAELENFSSNKKFITSSYEISIEEGTVIPIQPNAAIKSEINGLQIENNYLLVFASVLRLVLQKNSTTGNIAIYNVSLSDSYLQKSFFKKGFKAILIFLLSILLVNFFTFNHFFKKDQEITESVQITQSSTKYISSLKERVKQKEERVKNSEAMAVSRTSAMINEIAKQVPHSILLSEFIYNPIDKKIKANEAIILIPDVIVIKGKTLNNSDFTKWIENLEQLSYIDQVVISDFGKNDVNETVFSIRINLNSNEAKQKK